MQILHIDKNVNVKFNKCKTKACTKPRPAFVDNTGSFPAINVCSVHHRWLGNTRCKSYYAAYIGFALYLMGHCWTVKYSSPNILIKTHKNPIQ